MFAGLLNYFTASKIKNFAVYLIIVCGKQFFLRNKKKNSNSRPSGFTRLRDLRAAYCANEALTKYVFNKYILKHFSIFFYNESTKPKNYISLLIRVSPCFFPKGNTRQTLRHILALTVYVYT